MSVRPCARCGRDWEPPKRRGFPGKYCPPCKKLQKREANDRWEKNHPAEAMAVAVSRTEWVRLNPERRWRTVLKSRFGITVEQYLEMLQRQGGVCAICHEPPEEGKRLAVDHDHVTGKVRGLLHVKCNRAIGLLGDNAAVLQRAAEYLAAANEPMEVANAG